MGKKNKLSAAEKKEGKNGSGRNIGNGNLQIFHAGRTRTYNI